jgi:hypothetical protein
MEDAKYAVFFENGAWVVMRKDLWGNVNMREVCPSLETAFMAVSAITGGPCGFELITRKP